MKRLIIINLILMMNLLAAPIISIDINYVSTQWIKNLGTYRIIQLNSEAQPCFYVEYFKNGTFNTLTSSIKICKVNTDIKTIDIRENDNMWFENFRINNNTLNFNLNYPKSIFKCSIKIKNIGLFKPSCIK
jgi:hypothetical protein